jgi:hypothetical protein
MGRILAYTLIQGTDLMGYLHNGYISKDYANKRFFKIKCLIKELEQVALTPQTCCITQDYEMSDINACRYTSYRKL